MTKDVGIQSFLNSTKNLSIVSVEQEKIMSKLAVGRYYPVYPYYPWECKIVCITHNSKMSKENIEFENWTILQDVGIV